MRAWKMTDGEIATNFRQATDRRAQIRIIADLNLMSADEVVKKLIDLGFQDECLFKEKAYQHVPWTKDEMSTLMSMREAGAQWRDISRKLRRTVRACRRKAYDIRMFSVEKWGDGNEVI